MTRSKPSDVLDKPVEKLGADELRLIYDDDGNLVGMGQVDGTFEIRHRRKHIVKGVDTIDLGFLDDVLDTKTIRGWMKPLDQRSRFFKEAFENVFLMLLKPSPELYEVLSPAQGLMMEAMSVIMDYEEFEDLMHRCEMSVQKSAASAKVIVSAIAELLADEDISALNVMMDLGDDMNEAVEDMQKLVQEYSCGQAAEGDVDGEGKPVDGEGAGEGQECSECGKAHPKLRPKTAKEMGLTAEQARNRLRELNKKLADIRRKAAAAFEKNKDKLEDLVKAAASRGGADAAKTAKKIDDMAQSFGMEKGQLAKIPADDIVALSERYKNDRNVKDLLDQLGRMTKKARETMSRLKKTAENVRQDPVVLDDSIPRLMPNELINFRSLGRKREFKKRFLEKEAECFDTDGEQSVHRGPIVVCKDTSGSMRGAPNTWASALYLALSAVASTQRRPTVLVNFSDRENIRTAEFTPGDSFVKYIDEATFGFWGGTDFEKPLSVALDFVKKSKYNKADVLFLTDGICPVSEKFLEEFNRIKKEKEFKVLTVLINLQPGYEDQVAKFSDKVVLLSDLQKDDDVLNTAFAI